MDRLLEFPYDCPICGESYKRQASADHCCQTICDQCGKWYPTGTGDEISIE